MKRKSILVALCLMVMVGLGLGMASCTLNQNLTPEAKYLQALKWFNDTQTTYLAQYKVAGPQTQADWHAKIDPLFDTGDQILDAWKKGDASQEQLWIALQQNLIKMLTTAGVIQVQTK
jgi:hypothetical protein